MKGRATCFGAISIVNAIASGKGVTASVRLRTEAIVEMENKAGGWKVTANEKEAPSNLALESVRHVLKGLGKQPDDYSGMIETRSEMPMGVGLKSSSASSVAIALATVAALGHKAFDPMNILNHSVEASLASRASITGALDDASSCLLGGLNLADNLNRKIVRSKLFDKAMRVVIKVPKSVVSRRDAVDPAFIRKFGKVSEVFFDMSMSGDYWRAMTLNGVTFSAFLRYDPYPAFRAVELGALGAGLSGTGPAVAAVFDPAKAEQARALAQDWSADGSIVLETETNNEHGRIV